MQFVWGLRVSGFMVSHTAPPPVITENQANIVCHDPTRVNIFVPLDVKGCICYFVKWQIHPSYPRGRSIFKSCAKPCRLSIRNIWGITADISWNLRWWIGDKKSAMNLRTVNDFKSPYLIDKVYICITSGIPLESNGDIMYEPMLGQYFPTYIEKKDNDLFKCTYFNISFLLICEKWMNR